MSAIFTITVLDTATPEIMAKIGAMERPRKIMAAVGRELSQAWRNQLAALPPNHMGWPSTGFWEKAARSVRYEISSDGLTLTLIADHQGLRQRAYGGAITARDKALAIPARAEFYGISPTQFTNLKFIKFKSGAMALVIADGGTAKLNAKGKGVRVKGGGAKAAGLVAYWLIPKGESTRPQAPNPNVLPDRNTAHNITRNIIQEEISHAE